MGSTSPASFLEPYVLDRRANSGHQMFSAFVTQPSTLIEHPLNLLRLSAGVELGMDTDVRFREARHSPPMAPVTLVLCAVSDHAHLGVS